MEKENKKKNFKLDKKIVISGVCLIGIILLIILVVNNKEGDVSYKVKSSLDKLVEKSDLETVNFKYNVIAKQCKKKEKCDKTSNDIDDFEYVVSCNGTVTAGINFKDVEVKVDEENKKILITIPKAEVKEINVNSTKFLNGDDLPASELANARKLCDQTVEERSNNDSELLSAAQEQAKVVLEAFYGQWVKAFDEEYKVEVK